MRPAVPMAAQLADEAALSRPEDQAEHFVPPVPHQLEQRRDVPFGHRPIAAPRVIDKPQRGGVDPMLLDSALHLAVDEWAEARLQQLERLADTFVIGYCHVKRESRSASFPTCRLARPNPPLRLPRLLGDGQQFLQRVVDARCLEVRFTLKRPPDVVDLVRVVVAEPRRGRG